ncbi:thioredoxin family protein [Sulfurovum sp. CS9]|uniref:thioredoxin family protein n=1 Tax=Sulfurovum sp. CS9 TaxID=3391146 RepID=UPI0039EA2A22
MMKILFALLFFTLFINADHIHWLGNYDKALQKAQKEHKPLMVLLVKKECPPCNDVIKDFFMEQAYIKYLNQKFVSVIVMYEGKESYPIEMFYSTIFPTLFFVSSKTETFLSNPLYGKGINANTIENILKEL